MSSASSNTPAISVKEGQSVKFIPRDASTEARPVPYYDFYTSLQGTVAKLYDDGTAALIVDRSSLPDDARERHEKSERDMRDKWMRTLSEDDRSKLTDIQKQFSLRYTLLVSASDLIDVEGTPPAPKDNAARKERAAAPPSSAQPTPRPTEEALALAEAEHLEEMKRRSQLG